MDSSWDAWKLSQALSPDFTQLYQTKFYPAAHYVLGHQSSILQVLFNDSEGDTEVYIVPIACKLMSLGVSFLPISTQPLPPSALR